MFKFVVVFALFALAAATPVPETEKDLKADNSIGLGYGRLYGFGPLSTGVYNPYFKTVVGARSTWTGTYPWTYPSTFYNPTVYNPTVYNPWW